MEIINQTSSIPMQIGQEITLTLGHFKIIFNFMNNKLDDLLFGGWVFEILKKFHRDVIYDIFTNIMA